MTPPPDRFVTALRYSSDGRRIETIASTTDPEAGPALFTRFDARTGRRLADARPVNEVDWSPLLGTSDGTRLVTAGRDAVTVRDATTLAALETFAVPGAAAPWPAVYALSADDATLAVGHEDGSLRFLDLRTGAVRVASGRHGGPVSAVVFAPDGRTVYSGSEDGDAMVWDVREATAGETLSGHANGIASLAVTRDGRTLYTAGLDGTVFVWDLLGSRRLGRPFTAGAGNEDRPQIAFSSDGRLMAMGQDDGAISLVDTGTLARRKLIPVVDTGQVRGIGFVPGSRRLVVGGPRGFLALLDTNTGRVLRRLRGHSGGMYTPGISTDGRLLATGGDRDPAVRLWSLPDGRPLGVPLRFEREVWDVQLSPDGRRMTVVLVDEDFENGSVEVWDARNRRRLRDLRVTGFPGLARFSPDGRRLAVGFRDGRTQVWSTATWKPVGRPFAEDASGILGTAISPDGRTLATGSDTGTVRLWDVATGQAIGAPLPGVPSRKVVPTFTPDGTRLIASYDTGRGIVWDIRPERLTRHACAVAGRRLTEAEWADLLPRRPFEPAC